jgi:4-amino-4-deoxy-L-arabinose transferase-like glycosyltransferase
MESPDVSEPLSTEAALAEGVRGRERWLAAIACLTVVGLHLAVAARLGALGVSRNDDWTYYRVVFAVDGGGAFAPDPYTRTMLLGLIALARPVMAVFGESMEPLQIMVSALGALGLWAAWLLVRSILDRGAAAVSVATLALGPLWGAMATTFMTDVPAFTFQALALACAAVALRTPDIRWGWLVASLALCMAAFSIREYAVAATVAVLVAAAVRSPRRSTAWGVAGSGLVWLVAALALYTWRGSLAEGALAWTPQLPGAEELKALVRTVYTTGLLLSPAVVVLLLRSRGALVRRHWVCALVSFALLACAVIATDRTVLLGNYVTSSGAYPETVSGPLPIVVIAPVWALIVAVAVLSSTVLLTLAWSGLSRLLHRRHRMAVLLPRLRAADPGLVLAVVFTAAVVATVITIGFVMHNRIFDRYLMPMTPYAAATLLFRVRRRSIAAGVDPARPRWAVTAGAASLVVLAALGTAFVAGSASLDGAKWRLGERAVAAGFTAETVDASIEWFGFHQPAPIVMQTTTLTADSWWVTGLFDDPHVCALSTYLPEAGTSEPGSEPGGEPGGQPGGGPATQPVADPTVPGQGPVIASEQVWAPLGPDFELALRRTDVNCPAP